MAVDPDDFSPAHRSPQVFEVLNLSVGDRPVVLSVGRLSKEKNLPMVVEAVEQLQSRDPAPLLLLVGDGPERKRLEHGCQDKPFVSFVGLQCGDTLKRLYASAGVFVFASRVDTLGLVNVEAMLERHTGGGPDRRLHRRVRHPRRLGGMLRARRGRPGRRHRARPRRSTCARSGWPPRAARP